MLRLRRDGTARPLVRALPIAAVLAALAILPAACGGGAASPGVASLGSTTSTTAPAAGPPTTNGAPDGNSGAGAGSQQSTMSVGGITVDFARCMRTHGIPNFPDPNGQGQVTMNGVDPQSASFEAAERACAKYSPGGGKSPSPAQQQQMLAWVLKFSECMRSHGITDFPDPKVSSSPGGGIGISIKISGGQDSNLNPRNPQFQAAQKACQSLIARGKVTNGASVGSG